MFLNKKYNTIVYGNSKRYENLKFYNIYVNHSDNNYY